MMGSLPGTVLRRAALAALLASAGGAALAADDGSFPRADQVGGEVFPKGLQPGDDFPMDVTLYDADGKQLALGDVAKGKRTLLTFFITAAPASVAELKRIEAVAADQQDLTVVFANSDVVGTALFGGKDAQIPETVRTVALVKQEQGLNTPMYVAPNNVYDAHGLSNTLGFRGLPTSYLIDTDGKVVRTIVGTHEWSARDFAAATPGEAAGDPATAAPSATEPADAAAATPGATAAQPATEPAATGGASDTPTAAPTAEVVPPSQTETPPVTDTSSIGAPDPQVPPITEGDSAAEKAGGAAAPQTAPGDAPDAPSSGAAPVAPATEPKGN